VKVLSSIAKLPERKPSLPLFLSFLLLSAFICVHLW
jgi:hypothetical protein